MTYNLARNVDQLDACLLSGKLYLWVWVLGGVTSSRKELDPEPVPGRMYPTKALASDAAKKLGPKVWPVACLVELKGPKWAK